MRSPMLLARRAVVVAALILGMVGIPAGGASASGDPAITTDLADYTPGSVVTLTGDGWDAGEAVHLRVDDDESQSWQYNGDLAADGDGAFVAQFTLPNWFVARYTATATGASGRTATTTFTDGNVTLVVSPDVTALQDVQVVHYKDTNDTTCSQTADPPLTVTSGNNVGIGTNHSARLTVPSSVTSGGTTYTFTSWTGTVPSGSNSICVSGASSGTETANYVANLPQTIKFGSLANKTWGNADFPVSATASSGLPVTFTAGGQCTVAGNTVHIVASGSCTVTADQAGNATYARAPSVPQTFTINTAPLSVGVTGTQVYGGSPTFTPSYAGAGLVNGDTSAVVTGTLICSTNATAASPVGNAYTVSGCSGLSAANYTISYNPGTLSVTPAPLTVTVANASRTYGATNPALSGTISGLRNGDDITATYTTSATAASPIGAYAITPSLADPTGKLGNYTVTSTPGTLTVTTAALSVTAQSTARAYGASNPTFTGTLSGVQNGDDITASYSTTADASSPVGTYPITPSLADPTGKLGNYTVSSTPGTLTVTTATLNVTTNDASRFYGDDNPTFTGTIQGVQPGDNITVTYAAAADASSDAGTYAIVPTLVDPDDKLGNYTVGASNGTLTVNKAPLTITANDDSRLYGAANPQFTFSADGVKGTDVIDVSFSTAATATSAVGTYAIVPQANSSAPGALSNYAVTTVNGQLAVTPAPLTITAGDASREYGDPNPALGGTITGLLNGDAITAVYSTTAGLGSAVAAYPILPAAVGTPAALANYDIHLVNGTLTVTKAPLTLTAGNATREYGLANPAFSFTAGGVKNADVIVVSFTTAATETSDVGLYDIVPAAVSSSPGALSNYLVTNVTNGTLTVTPAPLTITADDTSREYGEANPGFTPATVAGRNSDVIAVSSTTAAATSSNVGTYAIVPHADESSPGALSNYTVTAVDGTLTVTAAPLTITAGDATRVYGDANPAFGGAIDGLKNDDAITASYATSAVAASPVADYEIVPTAIDSDPGTLLNYDVTLVNGTLTVTKASLQITAANATKVYGDSNPTFTGSIVGIENGDGITASYSTLASDGSPVGPYPIVPAAVDSVPGTLSNYTVSLVSGTLDVTQAPLTVTADNKGRTYGTPNPALTGTVVGVKNGDHISATYSTPATASSPKGDYPITPAVQDPDLKAGNYHITLTDGTLTIAAAPLTVSANDASREYGDGNPAFGGTLSGVLNGDDITATYETTATAASDVGPYAITPVLHDPDGKLGNYTIVSNNGTLTVSSATLTITADNTSRVYGDSNPALTGTVSGVKNDDGITASYGTAADETSDVGGYAITPAPVDPSGKLANYTVVLHNGTLTVTEAPLTVHVDDASRLYGDANPVFTGSIEGLRNSDNVTATYVSAVSPSASVGTYPIVALLNNPDDKLKNYTVTAPFGTLTVTPAPLSVTADGKTREYGEGNPPLTGTVLGVKNGDAITASYTTAATAASDVGSYDIVPVLQDPSSKLGNYDVTPTNGTLTVTKAPLSVTADNETREYGEDNPPLTGTVLGVQNGDVIVVSYTTAATPASDVGPYAILLSISGEKLGNYDLSAHNGTLTVTKAPLSVTADDTTRGYGDANPAFTGTVVGVKNGDAITASYTTAATAASDVGSYSIVPSASGDKLGNYAVSLHNGSLTVTKAPLSVTADNETREYGEDNPPLTGTVLGVKNGDVIVVSYTTAATPTSDVGPYVILLSISGEKLGNYDLSAHNGTLTVTKAPLSVTADDTIRGYGDANPAFTGTVVGIKNGDAIVASYTTAATAASNVGSYTIFVSVSGAKLSNYDVTAHTGTLTVIPAPLTVTASNKTRAYGASNPTFTGTLATVKNDDGITATYATSATLDSPVGSYAIIPTLVDPNSRLGNYSVTLISGTLTVTQAPLTVKANDAVKTLGAPNPAFTSTITGAKNGDVITVSYTTTATQSSPVGTYAIVPTAVSSSPGALSNYEVTTINGTLTIQYLWDGFLQPINDTAHQIGTQQSVFKAGSTVPVKFQLKDVNGNVIMTPFQISFLNPVNIGTSTAPVDESVYSDATDSGTFYRFDAGTYIYNWKTTKGMVGTKYRIVVHLPDNTNQFVDIALK